MKEYKKYIKTIVSLSLLLGYALIPMANAIKGMTYPTYGSLIFKNTKCKS
jgi:hypothetical protein